MSIEKKGLAVVGTERFVHALAVQKPVIENRDRRVFLIEDTAVDVDHRTHEYERTKSSKGWSTTKE